MELVDRRPAPQVTGEQMRSIVYVDNQVFAASRPLVGPQLRRCLQTCFEAEGLPMHDVHEDERVIEVLGLELDGLRLCGRLIKKKMETQTGSRSFSSPSSHVR